MEQMYSTRQAALILEIRPDLLQKAVWQGKVKSPPKSPSGSYLWSLVDVESAAWALKRYPEFNAWQRREGGAV